MAVVERPPLKLDELVEWVGHQHVKTSCAFCAWTAEGSFDETRAAFAAHRRARHPDLGEPRPRGRAFRVAGDRVRAAGQGPSTG